MSYTPPPGPPHSAAPPLPAPSPPPVRSRKGPVIMLLTGLAVFLVALAVVFASMASFLSITSSLSRIDGTGTTTRALEADSGYGLYGDSPTTSCTVTDPDGHDVPVSPTGMGTTVNGHTLFGAFTTTASGDYAISCTSYGAAGPLHGDHPVDVYVGDKLGAGSLAGRIVITIGAVFVGIIGGTLLIAGLVWLLVRSSGNKRALQARIAAGRSGAVQP